MRKVKIMESKLSSEIKNKNSLEKRALITRVEVPIRFSEVDSIGVVWHGHYIKFFEDAREAFGREFDLDYLGFYAKGYVVPIVKINCDYKAFLKYGDAVIVEIKYVDSLAAKIIFEYKLFNRDSNEIVATGQSVQVFLDGNRRLVLTVPTFFEEWKKRWGVI